MRLTKKIVMIIIIFMISVYSVKVYAGAVGPERPGGTSQAQPGEVPYSPGQQLQQQQEREEEIQKPGTIKVDGSGGFSGESLVDPIENPDEYEPKANSKTDNIQFVKRANVVIGILQFVGTAISVITLMTLGIRYMLAGIQEKALYKETMGPYLIGAVMVFAIPNIIAIVYDFITGNIKDI